MGTSPPVEWLGRVLTDLGLGTLLCFVVCFALIAPPLELLEASRVTPLFPLALWAACIGLVHFARKIRKRSEGGLKREKWLGKGIVINPAIWRKKLEDAERRVCRIELDGVPIGTGFLVGPGLVATCHHVLAPVVEGALATSRVTFRFDYQLKLIDGAFAVVTEGTTFALGRNWVVFSSPTPKGGVNRQALDLLILRLEADTASMTARGAFSVSAERAPWDMNDGVLVLQHPHGQDLKASFNPEIRVGRGPSTSGLDVAYSVSTLPGSSGAPVLNSDFELLAMHQAAGPGDADFNVGLRADTIAEVLEGSLPNSRR